MKTMFANLWTTIVGFLAGFAVYIAENGIAMPQTGNGWKALLVAAALAGLGYVSKDATTGSKPPAAR